MKREFLAELGLDDGKIDQIMAEHGKTVNPLKEENENFKTDYETLKAEKSNLEKQIESRDAQLDELSKNTTDHEALKQQIEGLKQANEEAKNQFQQELRKQKLDFSLDKALIQANARNPITVKALLDPELIKLNDEGELVGLSEQLEKLKESDGYLFNDTTDNTSHSASNTHIPGSHKKSNNPKNVDPYELGRQRAMNRFKKEEN